jgi:hypothetical protein
VIHRSNVLRVGVLALAALAGAVASRADVLHLRTGGRLEGVLVNKTPSTLTIDIGMGQISVPRSAVVRIEEKQSALAEYRNRLATIDPGDVRAWVELARFAGNSGLRSEARLMWARVVSLDPRNVEGHLALGHVLVASNWVDEAEMYRANGFVYYEGRWMTPAEQSYLLREREQRAWDDRRSAEARREARDAEDRARRAEAEAARARAAASSSSGYPVWGYGAPVIVGSPHWGGYTAGCSGASCNSVPQIWTPRPAAPSATPIPQAPPVQPSGLRRR